MFYVVTLVYPFSRPASLPPWWCRGDRLSYENPTVQQMLKTQDLGYVSTHRSADEKKAAKLRESLHMLDAGPRNKHTIFFDSEKEAKK